MHLTSCAWSCLADLWLARHAGVLLILVALESAPNSSEDLSTKCRRALKSIVAKLTSLPALDALVHQQLPESVMKMVLEQVSCQVSVKGC